MIVNGRDFLKTNFLFAKTMVLKLKSVETGLFKHGVNHARNAVSWDLGNVNVINTKMNSSANQLLAPTETSHDCTRILIKHLIKNILRKL